ncbi:hypothetical protein EW145_g43 [Phellinidium pouzarii]|uniref:DUF7719 domain-containing protein n=1 Tax=Phellinidium pouzarii TaxID=167371 RepID=A0A4S4LJX6_9AGAM|nr:hypothetical protein EW145_g43 [Phellinidium pouzarii]
MPRQRKLKTPSKSKTGEIPEDEQWRIIENSGVLKNIPRDTPPSGLLNGRVEEANDELPETPFCNEIFNAILLIIPFSSLHITMDIYTTQSRATNASSVALPVCNLWFKVDLCGQLVELENGDETGISEGNFGPAPAPDNNLQCPPLGTMWIYTIVQLDLLPAVIGLGLVAGFVKWKDLKIVFN